MVIKAKLVICSTQLLEKKVISEDSICENAKKKDANVDG